jgi:hypothetical protein
MYESIIENENIIKVTGYVDYQKDFFDEEN